MTQEGEIEDGEARVEGEERALEEDSTSPIANIGSTDSSFL